MPSNEDFSIIPKPNQIQLSQDKNKFELNSETAVICNSETEKIADYLKQLIFPASQIDLKKQYYSDEISDQNNIFLVLDSEKSKLGPEGYHIDITQTQIKIDANQIAGLFYGIQTIRQLLPVEIESPKPISGISWVVPCMCIQDIPRFSWRGFMFDEGRHFHGIQTIKKYLDLMALMKLNTFHWHLTEDQGWRIEIKKYPKLTEIGSKRKKMQLPPPFNKKGGIDAMPNEGFYSQNDIKEIIEYASDRFITIIPEIEMPGHSQAALAAYPELGCTGGPYEVSTHFGVHKDVYCVGKEKTIAFLQDILSEVMDLFPSKIIHVGGDEVPKARWNECIDCQNKIKAENLKDSKALQVYFTNRMAQFLADHDHRLMGWNEILDENLNLNAIGQYWTGGVEPIIAHLEKGRNFVVSNNKFMYLDHSYRNTSLNQAYEYEPIPEQLSLSFHPLILGIEAPLWTEWIPTLRRADYQTFPRLIAFAETAWSMKDQKNYGSFLKRLEAFERRLDFLNVKYAKGHQINPNSLQKFMGKIMPFPFTSSELKFD